jgi:hypothetical protein
MARSTAGLVAAAICHLSIYAFMLLVERPFLRRVHGLELAPIAIAPTTPGAP